MFATSAGYTDTAIVGGRSIDITIAPTETYPYSTQAFLTTSMVLPPDTWIVAPVSVRSASGIRPASCSLVEPCMGLTEDYGVIVGHTLIAASSWSAEPTLPSGVCETLPYHLEDIVTGSHPSLGEAGRLLLRSLLHRYEHVFPAPGEPVTGYTTSVHHEILTSDARPVRCGPRRLAPAGLRMQQTCVKEMLLGGQIEPSDSKWASPVVLVTKKDGSTRFCVDYRRLSSLTIKDAYPLPRIDDSFRLLGNQQWFSTMDLASGYWQVAMSPEAKRKAAFVMNEGLFQFWVMPFGLCNAPATLERLMDRVLCGIRWSQCLASLMSFPLERLFRRPSLDWRRYCID